MAETVAAALKRLRRAFEDRLIATAALDARVLVQHVTQLDHAALIAMLERLLDAGEVARLADCAARRETGEPVSRILGLREFYGRDFLVTPDVLDPRPDTETVVDLCLKHFDRNHAFRFADMGAGSGAIAVTLLAERPLARAVAVDISAAALGVVKRNAEAHGVLDRLELVQSDWYSSVHGVFDLIVSNPPYIRDSDIARLNVGVRDHDPHLALAGGADGLDCYRALATQPPVRPQGLLVVEAGLGQAEEICSILCGNGFAFIEQAHDLTGIIRAIGVRRN